MRTWIVAAVAVIFCATAAQAEVPLPRPRPAIKIATPDFCLAHIIYEEARGESDEGQLLVGFVTKIRSWHGRRDWGGFGICAVASYAGQYQGFKNLSTWVPEEPRAWEKAKRFAGMVLRGEFVPRGELRYATYYLSRETSSLKGRCWFDRDLIPIKRIGEHFFYREPLPQEAADLKASAMPEDCPLQKPSKQTVVARR